MPYIPTVAVLNLEQKKRITEELKRKGALRPCARCGNGDFGILDYIFANNPQQIAGAYQFASPNPLGGSYPTIALFCTNCGAVYYHVLGMLIPLQEFGLGR